ncbi:hypothetical protein ARAF_0402 [Arsenophonus endosymbiont of Aleurodicus floccissimus]|nr:hypothetical protein ARAF_0402 [Arsenophonus endosymbiont of Aleurodicus floccissimus]
MLVLALLIKMMGTILLTIYCYLLTIVAEQKSEILSAKKRKS